VDVSYDCEASFWNYYFLDEMIIIGASHRTRSLGDLTGKNRSAFVPST
jgi:hypothetical protein